MNLQNFFYRESCKMQRYGDTTKERKWLYVDYEKVNKVLMMIFEKKYNIKINAKVRERSETNANNKPEKR